MNLQTYEAIQREIVTTDWTSYDGPHGYKSERVAETLLWVLDLRKEEDVLQAWGRVVSVLGSDHSGTYFPALLPASKILIEIVQNTKNRLQRNCIRSILNDFYYFEPTVDGYSGVTKEELRAMIEQQLNPYSDENYFE